MASTELQDTDSSEYPYLSDLKSWYASVRSFRMDILGDFSGSELFLVEGDSLVRYAIVSAAVRGGEVSMASQYILSSLILVEDSSFANDCLCLSQMTGRSSTLLPQLSRSWPNSRIGDAASMWHSLTVRLLLPPSSFFFFSQ